MLDISALTTHTNTSRDVSTCTEHMPGGTCWPKWLVWLQVKFMSSVLSHYKSSEAIVLWHLIHHILRQHPWTHMVLLKLLTSSHQISSASAPGFSTAQAPCYLHLSHDQTVQLCSVCKKQHKKKTKKQKKTQLVTLSALWSGLEENSLGV